MRCWKIYCAEIARNPDCATKDAWLKVYTHQYTAWYNCTNFSNSQHSSDDCTDLAEQHTSDDFTQLSENAIAEADVCHQALVLLPQSVHVCRCQHPYSRTHNWRGRTRYHVPTSRSSCSHARSNNSGHDELFPNRCEWCCYGCDLFVKAAMF